MKTEWINELNKLPRLYNELSALVCNVITFVLMDEIDWTRDMSATEHPQQSMALFYGLYLLTDKKRYNQIFFIGRFLCTS